MSQTTIGIMRRLFSLSGAISIIGMMLCIILFAPAASAKTPSPNMPITFASAPIVTSAIIHAGTANSTTAFIENRDTQDEALASYVSAVDDIVDDISLPTRGSLASRGMLPLAWDFSSHASRLLQNTSRLYRPPLI